MDEDIDKNVRKVQYWRHIFWGKVQIIFPPTLTLLLGAEVGVHGVALEQPGAVQRELDTVPTPAEKMIR